MRQKCVKNTFFKNDPGPFMMLKQVVLAHFQPVATGFGSWKIPKYLENGPFWDPKWVKNGSKTDLVVIFSTLVRILPAVMSYPNFSHFRPL